jgi:hypothetical protein
MLCFIEQSQEGMTMGYEESDLAFQSLRKRLEIMELMTESMKWITSVAEENEKLRKSLGDHDLTRIELMESEREREDLRLLAESLRQRLDMWQSLALDVSEILFQLEKKGVKFTKAQQRKLAKLLKEKYAE